MTIKPLVNTCEIGLTAKKESWFLSALNIVLRRLEKTISSHLKCENFIGKIFTPHLIA